MSTLRIAGVLIGLAGLIATFLFFRGPKWKKSNFILFGLFSFFLTSICINPNILNFLRNALALETVARGRIIALLIVSNIFLLLYSFYKSSKLEKIRLQLDMLVRSLSAVRPGHGDDISDRLKPIMILIPAYNEAENLKALLPVLPKYISGLEVGTLVVDDGSEDETFQTAEHMENVCVVKNIINRGGGAALRLGYDILKKGKADICVTMDADGQHQPQEIIKLVSPIIKGEYDCVIGSRVIGEREKDSMLRITGVYLFGIIISMLLGKKITDPSSGFRAFKMKAMSPLMLHEDQYHTSELLIEAVKKGFRLGEVPIKILKRKHGKSKKGKDWVYGFHFAKTIIKTWWR